MPLPKIEHNLFGVNLSVTEKIEYMKARCLISACLNAESDSVVFEQEKEAIDTIKRLNKKIWKDND
jgi:hypothetical protein